MSEERKRLFHLCKIDNDLAQICTLRASEMTVSRRDTFSLATAFLVAPAAARSVHSASSAPVPVRARLGVTENPFGPSAAARRAVEEATQKAAFYPDDEDLLINRICTREGLGADHVAISSGSLDALSHLSVGIGRGGQIVAPQPAYSTHLGYAQRQGVGLDWVPLQTDHQIDLDAMLDRIGGAVKLVYVCNPNNPTGLFLDPLELRAFCIAAAMKVPVLIDEAYFELAPDPQRQSMAGLIREGHDVIVTRTFSKAYGLAGLRIGYTLARPERVRMLRGLVTTSRNRAGLAGAMASLGDQDYLAGAARYLRQCRALIYRICEANKLGYIPSEATYVYVDCDQPATLVQERLRTLGVEVRLFDSDRYSNWMRIGTATPDELEIFARVLPRALFRGRA